MGGRGSFIDVNSNNFVFKDAGQTYFTIGTIGEDIRILEKPKGSVNAPEFSHTENRIYAVVQHKELKYLAFYDEDHKQIKSVDFGHPHGWNHIIPHVHLNLEHIKEEAGIPPSQHDLEIANKVNEWIKNYYKKGR